MSDFNKDITSNYKSLHDEIYLSEKEKLKPAYFNDQADFFIETLAYDNVRRNAARNYYSGKRDILDFEYLEDIYGMQNPIDLGFTNIIKPRVDALVGLSILSDPIFSAAYTDAETLKAVDEEKYEGLLNELTTEMGNSINTSKRDQENTPEATKGTPETMPPKSTQETIKKIAEKYGPDYVSSYEVAAQHLLRFIETDSEIDLFDIKKEISKDYFITGEAYTRELYKGDGKDPKKIHVEPEYIFTNRPRGDRDLKRTDVIVSRKYLPIHHVLKELGDIITVKEAEELYSSYTSLSSERNLLYGPPDANVDIKSGSQMDSPYRGEQGNPVKTGWSDVAGGLPDELVLFYHVEWLASTKIPDGNGGYVYREDRYECYRIGPDLHIGGRRCDEAPRRRDSLWKTTLSYKGIINTNPSGMIESMVSSMREVQDLYDIMMFFRNNTVANSGVSGSRVNVAAIPKALGDKFMPRLLKWVTIRKQGLELIDPTEEGANLFQHYGDFNAAIPGDAIQAINAILESLTAQADIVSGVPRQMLGVIEQRDAVENVKVGINQVSVLSLEMFRDIDRCLNRGMQETLDNYKWAYRNQEKQGLYKLGKTMVPFILSPTNFSLTDFKVTVLSSGIENGKLLKIQTLAKELVAAGALDPDVIIKIINMRSVREIESVLAAAVARKKEENANLQQLQQQLEEGGKKIKQLEAEIVRIENNKATLEKEKLEVEKQKNNAEAELLTRELDLREKKDKRDDTNDKSELIIKSKVADLEKEELLFATGRAREVNNSLTK